MSYVICKHLNTVDREVFAAVKFHGFGVEAMLTASIFHIPPICYASTNLLNKVCTQ
jgi:hypothetical protein